MYPKSAHPGLDTLAGTRVCSAAVIVDTGEHRRLFQIPEFGFLNLFYDHMLIVVKKPPVAWYGLPTLTECKFYAAQWLSELDHIPHAEVYVLKGAICLRFL